VEVVPRRAGEEWVFHNVDFLALCYGVPTDDSDAAHCKWVVAANGLPVRFGYVFGCGRSLTGTTGTDTDITVPGPCTTTRTRGMRFSFHPPTYPSPCPNIG
jgi:hypothetical protein